MKAFLVVTLLFFSSLSLHSQNFKRIYDFCYLGGPAIPTQDGGYLACGQKAVKVDLKGDTVWTRTLPLTVYKILEVNDGYLLVGASPSLFKLSKTGQLLLINSYPWTNWITDILLTSDQNLLLVTANYTPSFLSAIMQTNLDGDTTWRYNKTNVGEIISDLVEFKKGSYAYVQNGGSSIYMLNALGKATSTQYLKTEFYSYSVSLSRDSNILVAGFQKLGKIVPRDGEVVLVKYQPGGDTLWTQRYYLTEDASSFTRIVPRPSGKGYAFCFITSNNWMLIEVDEQGNIIRQTSFPETSGRSRLSLEVSGKNYLLSGTHGANLYLYLVVLAEDVLTPTLQNTAGSSWSMPNPFNGDFLLTPPGKTGKTEIFLYNVQGMLVGFYSTNNGRPVWIKGAELPQGFYTCRILEEENQVYLGKLVKGAE